MFKFSVLVLYDPHSLFTDSVRQHLITIGKSNYYKVHYAAATDEASCYFNPEDYDIIIIHYCVRVALGWHLSSQISSRLKSFDGKVVLFLQDEYDYTEKVRQFIDSFHVDLVFTCVPKAEHNKVYPTQRFPNTKFVHTLTGFTLPYDNDHRLNWTPLEDRSVLVGYRGRKLPPVYGNLGREKYLIGQGIKDLCEKQNLVCDIEWDENKRLYGTDWHAFLRSSRASLGTESGSNVFDIDGSIRTSIDRFLAKHPNATFDETYDACVKPFDDYIQMNQISPRLFESIMAGTVLILFEGNYSGILKPETHYFSLKKDFSNAQEIFGMLEEIDKLESMRQSAYKDIIESELVSFGKFRDDFEQHILALMAVENTDPRPYTLTASQLNHLFPRPSADKIHGYLTSEPIDATIGMSSNSSPTKIEVAKPDKNGLPFPNQPMWVRRLAKTIPWSIRQKVKQLLGKQ